jgi:hypothetical protein
VSAQILGVVIEMCVDAPCATRHANIARIFKKSHKPANAAEIGVSRDLLRAVSWASAPMSAETLHDGFVYIAYGDPQLVEPKQKVARSAFVLRAGADEAAPAEIVEEPGRGRVVGWPALAGKAEGCGQVVAPSG